MSGDLGWNSRPLGKVASLTMGQSPDSRFYSTDDTAWPFLQGCAEFQSRFPAPALFCRRKGKLGERGSILFSVRAPVGRINVADRDYVIGRGLAAVNAVAVDQDYLEHYLRFIAPACRAASQGSTFEAINGAELSAWPISFPQAEPEQTKIAEILSAMDVAIEQTESLIAKQERIKTGLMRDLLTRGVDENGDVRAEGTHKFKDSSLGRMPVEWNGRPLGEIAHVFDPNPSHRYPPSVDAGVPITSTENFDGDNEFDLKGADHVPRSVFEAQMKRCQYGPTDVVFARKGRIGLARPYGLAEKVFSHTVVLIKSKKTSELINEFLLWAVRDPAFFAEIDKRMNSNSGVPTLGVQFLSAIPIRVPDVDEQRRIAKVISESEAAIQREREVHRKLLSLKEGLMQDLLTGRKRVTPLLKAENQPTEQVA